MFKNRIWILKQKDEKIALTKAHSKEEAIYKFSKAYGEEITGDMIRVAKFDFCDIEVIK